MEIAVVRGNKQTLHEMGMERVLDGAEMVIEVPAHHDQNVADQYGQTNRIRFIEPDPVEQVFVNCMEQIKAAWEKVHPDEAHLAHAAAGTWFFYWFSPDMQPISALLVSGDVDGLRKAAADYIDSGFGADRGPELNLEPPEEGSDWISQIPGFSLSHT